MQNISQNLPSKQSVEIATKPKRWYTYKSLWGIIILAIITSSASYLALKKQLGEQPIISLEASKSFSKDSSKEEIFKSITKNSWCPKNKNGDYHIYKFKADGSYTISYATDYATVPETGKWNFEKNSSGDWILLYDNGERRRFIVNNNYLTIDNRILDICQPLNVSEAHTSDTLPPIQLSSELKTIQQNLTEKEWKRGNDLNLSYAPTNLKFNQNYEYVATYRNGECQNTGIWYATLKGIFGNSFTDNCDPRDDKYPEQLDAVFLDSGFLSLGQALYVPKDYLLQKGVISIFGYPENVNIKVEYDMPIKKGVLNHFDIEMTNVKKDDYHGPITLQRFSLTESYVRDYRQTENTIANGEEIAGKDLGSKVLQPGETYKFSLDVIFNKSGKQSFYINAWMYDSTQSWDTHQSYESTMQ